MLHQTRNLETFNQYLKNISASGRTMLLPALLEAQYTFGFISQDNARQISLALDVPHANVTGVIEFYAMLYTEMTAQTIIRVCTSPTCSALGGRVLYKNILEKFDGTRDFPTADGKYYIEQVACLGLCDQAPSSLVGSTPVGRATVQRIQYPTGDFQTQVYAQENVITRRFGKIDPININDYIAFDGFTGLNNALDIESDYICDFMSSSGLLGRGGAAFTTRTKWESASSAPGEPKYIVCNADESEPGTFKDRVLLENDPFAILEGMIIAGFAIGAEKGYIYIRGEYLNAQHIFQDVIETARDRGFLGEDILGHGFSFDIEVRSGAGAYICGEETALFESIEGKRGFPRLKPPYPTSQGLFGKPTVINNVETFANVSLMMQISVESYCKYGSSGSTGPWLFCLSGNIAKPGLYEITQPVTLNTLVEMAGGVAGSSGLQAVLLGGAAGKFVHPDQLEILLTQEDTRAAGLALGSGAVVVFNQDADLKQCLSDLGHFFDHESCGKCFPCQLGTRRQSEILDRIWRRETLPGDMERLLDIGWTMTDASLCGLGQTAASAVLSAIDHWPGLFQ